MNIEEIKKWYTMVLQKWNVFTGRSRRKEYWTFTLVNVVIGIVINILGSIISQTLFGIIGLLFCLALIIPGIAVGIRRLHDVGKSGWWLLISLVPVVGVIVLIIFLVTDSQAGSNQYGANPKGA